MALLNDLTMGDIVSRIAAMLIFVALHGRAVMLLARLFGYRGSATDHGGTWGPLQHISVWGVAMAVLFRTGWARLPYIDAQDLRGGRWALVVIALGALAFSLALMPLLDFARPWIAGAFPRTAGYAVLVVIVAFQEITVLSVALNLLPLPGLTGGLIFAALVPLKPRIWNRMVAIVLVTLTVALVAGLLRPDRLLPVLLPLVSRL